MHFFDLVKSFFLGLVFILVTTLLTYPISATLLRDAVLNNDLQAIRSLLEDDTKGELLLTKITKTQETALHVAVSYFIENPTHQALEVIELLLQTTIILFTAKDYLYPFLPRALFLREVGRKTLAFSAINTLLLQRDAQGRTALHLAINFENDNKLQKKLIHSLLNNNTAQGNFELLSQTDNYNETVLHYMAKAGNVKILRWLQIADALLPHCTNQDLFTQKENDQKTPLHLAIESGNLKIVALLLPHCKNPDIFMQKDNHKKTPLHLAVESGDSEIVEVLLHYYTNQDIFMQKDHVHKTPLHRAIECDDPKIVELLLPHCKNPNLFIQQDNDNKTPLHLAIECRNPEIVTLLLRHLHKFSPFYTATEQER